MSRWRGAAMVLVIMGFFALVADFVPNATAIRSPVLVSIALVLLAVFCLLWDKQSEDE